MSETYWAGTTVPRSEPMPYEKIHPFDLYELMCDLLKKNKITIEDWNKVEIGMVEFPVSYTEDGEEKSYLNECKIMDIGGKLYCQTTTVPAVTKNII